MKEILSKLVDGNNLTKEETMHAQELILTGQVTPAQIACFLTALRMKGETLDEITGLASVLRDKAQTIAPKVDNYVDFVGTGGDCTYSLIFQRLQRLSLLRLAFRSQNTETVPSLPRAARVMCLRHWALTSPQIHRSGRNVLRKRASSLCLLHILTRQ